MIYNAEKIKRYFDRDAETFDTLYSGQRNYFMRLFDRLFRKDIYDRFILTMEECRDITGKTVLDVGCGSGRYSVELAVRGAAKVVGIDVSDHMLQLAKQLAKEKKVADKCDFIQADFMKMNFEEQFDYILSLGIFDYIADAHTFLGKLQTVTRNKVIASFPKNVFPRAFQRRVRYKIKHCPLYLYSKADVQSLAMSIFHKYCIRELQGDYFVVFT